MRIDLRPATLPARVRSAGPATLATVVASLAVALGAPAWATTALTAVAFLLTAERLVRRRQLGWADAVATAAAGLIIVLMLLGFLLNLLPGGLGRVSWAVGAGVLALLAIAWSERPAAAGAQVPAFDRRTLTRLAPAYVVAAGLAAVALIVSVHATRQATEAPDSLSLVRGGSTGRASVEISSGRAAGSYELVVTSGGRQVYVGGPFTLATDEHVRRTVRLPADRRSVVSLLAAGSSTALKSLVISPAAAGQGTP